MENLEQFVSMSNCPEIQAGHEFEEGDEFACLETLGGHSVPEFQEWRSYVYCEELHKSDDSYIWLPSQRQLQSMVKDYTIQMVVDFSNWAWKYVHSDSVLNPDTASWDMLWLHFVMHKKFGKVWDGQVWK